MKKYGASLVSIAFSVLLFCGVPTISLAQSSIAIISQGVLNTTDTTWSTGQAISWIMEIGSGYTATTTGAFTAPSFKLLGATANSIIVIQLDAYKDSAYSTQATSSIDTNILHCVYDSKDLTSGGDYTSTTNPFVQLSDDTAYFGGAVDSCIMQSKYFYKVSVTYNFTGQVQAGVFYRGNAVNNKGWGVFSTASSSVILPQFDIVGGGFYITPTTQSTGLFLSGAQEFCNAQFGTTTGIVNGLANDFGNAICQAVGYLFVPTPSSIQAFTTIPTTLGNTPPISWFGQIKDTIQNADASSTENFINLTINFGTTTQILGFQNLTVISTSTINKYMSDATRHSFRNLIAVVFYLATASFVYFEIKKLWKTT